MASKLLIKGGRLVTFKKGSDVPHVFKSDVLVEGDKIAKISENIDPPQGAEIIDAARYIVAPGFIDTHRHMWQGAMKTVTGDCTLQEYVWKFLFSKRVRNMTSEDAYIGQLAGALEAIWCGVTTVVDHCHLTLSETHMEHLVAGTVDAGLRSHFCYSRSSLPDSVDPFEFPDPAEVAAWQIPQLLKLAAPGGISDNHENRVSVGLAYDQATRGPPEEALALLTKFRETNPGGVITAHVLRGPNYGYTDAITHWHKHAFLQRDVLFSHANNLEEKDWQKLKEADAGIASTPEDEFGMSHGQPASFVARRHGVRAGLGVDVVSAVSGDMFAAMRFALQNERGRRNVELLKDGKLPHHLHERVADVFRIATLGGAEAIHREHELGSLEVGKKADIILVRRDSPNMAGHRDPASALVLNANVGDVHTVIINGEVMKRNGKFVRHDWPEIAVHLEESRLRIEANAESEEVVQRHHDKNTASIPMG